MQYALASRPTRSRCLTMQVLLAVGLSALGGCEAVSQVAVRGASGASGASGATSTTAVACLESGADCTGETCCDTLACCGGKCSDPASCVRVPDCKVVSLPCSKNAECCSGACAATGQASVTGKICQGLDGCRPIGESCRGNEECCSRKCAESNGSLKCVLTNENALAPGELCGSLAKFDLSCQVQPSGNAPCVFSRAGVERCRSFENGGGPKPLGAVCATASECPLADNPNDGGPALFGSNFCQPYLISEMPYVTETKCSNQCRVEGEYCRTPSDCCNDPRAPGASSPFEPLTCTTGLCTASSSTCRELSSPCDGSDQCCSGVCSELFGGGTNPSPPKFCSVPKDPPPSGG